MSTKGQEILKKWQGDEASSPVNSSANAPDTTENKTAGRISEQLSPTPMASTADEDEQRQIGQELATIFKDNNIHPVLVFGSKGSGKSSLLASLLRYIHQTNMAAATLTLRDDIFPADDARWAPQIAWARDFFYKKVFAFISSEAPRSTLEESPFFIPVKLTLTTGVEINFAFLEGRGEWYMPNPDADVPFRPFLGLLNGLLQQYNGPSTVIYVAPFTTGGYTKSSGVESTGSNDLRNSDLGLLGAINEYGALRRAVLHHDSQLFLMTKWDISCDGIASEAFLSPRGEDLEDAIRERFALSWARFMNLNSVGRERNKTFSAYCAGVIDGKNILPPAQEDVDVIDRYPRKLWNWLCVNHTGVPLYFDMQPKKEGLLDKLIHLIRG